MTTPELDTSVIRARWQGRDTNPDLYADPDIPPLCDEVDRLRAAGDRLAAGLARYVDWDLENERAVHAPDLDVLAEWEQARRG